MSAVKEQIAARKGKQSGRRYTRKDSGTADWMSVNPQVIQYAVSAAAYAGGALRLGYTRDGGAYAIGVYGDGDPYTEYVPPKDDVEEVLKDLAEVFRDIKGLGEHR